MRTIVRSWGRERPLTERQAQVLGYIREHTIARGYSPSVREIGQGVGLASSGSVQHHIEELEAKGYIFRGRGRGRRTIRVLQASLPEQAVPLVPLIGRVAAGQPLLAVANIDDYIPVPAGTVRVGEGYFALRVAGDSMTGAGILDGDVVIVRPLTEAASGAIVVARLENDVTGDAEVSVKRLRRSGRVLQLLAENPAYGPLDASHAIVEGIVVGLMRAY